MILAIGMNLSNTAHKEMPINVESAGVIRVTTLVCPYFLSDKLRVTFSPTDYEWYSCHSRYDKLFTG
jgi:hypothetical protein